MTETKRKVLFRTGYYEPLLEEDENGLLFYSMPIESGFISFIVDVPITQADFDVLVCNEERFLLLYAALHQPCQLRHSHPTPEQFREYLDIILHKTPWHIAELKKRLTYLEGDYLRLKKWRNEGESRLK